MLNEILFVRELIEIRSGGNSREIAWSLAGQSRIQLAADDRQRQASEEAVKALGRPKGEAVAVLPDWDDRAVETRGHRSKPHSVDCGLLRHAGLRAEGAFDRNDHKEVAPLIQVSDPHIHH
ncbi:hypothetical protein FQV39_26035 [Bosea sp. F3-2]|uniref:hypothetical protein n=1 Tax=Bosea sp. F3-2 TaxID=2599640 RepID=UPI0011EC9C76|nr:hypothetical protein [Bosea sp. F3-2]QEL25671.1 hypothetical protein FQV39_26035 [Bosea sp. F3-2]